MNKPRPQELEIYEWLGLDPLRPWSTANERLVPARRSFDGGWHDTNGRSVASGWNELRAGRTTAGIIHAITWALEQTPQSIELVFVAPTPAIAHNVMSQWRRITQELVVSEFDGLGAWTGGFDTVEVTLLPIVACGHIDAWLDKQQLEHPDLEAPSPWSIQTSRTRCWIDHKTRKGAHREIQPFELLSGFQRGLPPIVGPVSEEAQRVQLLNIRRTVALLFDHTWLEQVVLQEFSLPARYAEGGDIVT